MKRIIRILLVLFPFMLIGQTKTQNYIKTVNYKVPVLTKISSPTFTQASQSTTYYDGLGRPIQSIQGGQSDSGKDIITHIKYDGFGRQTEEYLPFKSSASDMAFDTAAETNVLSYYANPTLGVTGNPAQESTLNPFSKIELESSPLNRVLKQASPGNDWKLTSGHEVKMDYQSNVLNEVRLFRASVSWDAASGLYVPSFTSSGYYAQNQLSKVITYDENTLASPSESNGSSIEFKNKQGQVVLKRTYGAVASGSVNEKHDTYYVYDNYGNLTYVIPPKASDLITDVQTSGAVLANIISSASVKAQDAPLYLVASNSIVLQPGFTAEAGSTFSAVIDPNQTILDDLCYQYKYDYRNRLAEKKLPGKQWEFIVYDKLDRVVAVGPTFSPFQDISSTGWIITKYDVFSRPVYTGWLNSTAATSTGRAQLQSVQNTVVSGPLNETKQASGTIDGISAYYSNLVAPTSLKLLTVNYYDNYAFPSSPAIPIPSSVEGQPVLGTSEVKGMETASWTRVLTTSSSVEGETVATFYDLKVRPVRVYIQNHLKGYTCTDSQLDFSGKTISSTIRHKRTDQDAELVTKDVFSYSSQDRLASQTHQINGVQPAEVLLSNTYDELGNLISKKVGGAIQNINYTYNIRGWLTSINDTGSLLKTGDPKDLFAFKINYNNSSVAGIDPLYNGNISETYWTSASETNPLIRGYGYSYDKLDRLKTSIFVRSGLPSNAYNENMTYDKNGNILSIKRNGANEITATSIDDLVYSYRSNTTNQLMKVTDNATGDKSKGFIDSTSNTIDDYDYDSNGNLIKDNNKNITQITYNHLDLPIQITFASNENIVYVYDAAGQKLKKTVNRSGVPAAVTEYLNGFQYLNGVLRFFPTAEGYVEHNSGVYKYVYQYKDHLGNIRLSYDKNLVIQEENNYYPFGLKHFGYNNNSVSSHDALKYKYNGKELQDENIGGQELALYDYGARNYDPALARWFNLDPLSEKFEQWSPYNYVLNNPLKLIDPTGMSAEDSTDVIKNADGTYTVVGGNANDGDNSIYQLNTDGSRTRIGYSATPYSFYNTDLNAFMGNIDPKNNSGREFLNRLLKENPGEAFYGYNATGGQQYDFKRTNGTKENIYTDVKDFFRGMPILGKENGLPIFASARDIGNIGAGLVIGRNGSSWGFARAGFDALESYQKGTNSKETNGTVYAERLGWNIGSAIYQRTELARIPGNAHFYNTTIPKGYIGLNFKQKR